jgi:leader peptidase (prepilin peptidase) / N-methyltransferase
MGYDALPQWLWLTTLFLFGLVFGSFGNVVIWRLPRKESLSSPPSHCPKCDTPIRWYDNIPLVSWLVLGGKCRDCKAPISPRYPGVELLCGVLWLAAGWRFGESFAALAAALLFYLLVLLAFIDWDTMRLPNSLVGIMFVSGLAGAAVSQFSGVPVTPLLISAASGPLAAPLVSALAGALAAAGIVLLIGLVYSAVRGGPGYGMGDVKLLAAMGVYLGLYSLMALFIGTLIGAVYGVISARRAREGGQHRFPFGPFLAIGGVATVLVGPWIWAWYAGIARIGL